MNLRGRHQCWAVYLKFHQERCDLDYQKQRLFLNMASCSFDLSKFWIFPAEGFTWNTDKGRLPRWSCSTSSRPPRFCWKRSWSERAAEICRGRGNAFKLQHLISFFFLFFFLGKFIFFCVCVFMHFCHISHFTFHYHFWGNTVKTLTSLKFRGLCWTQKSLTAASIFIIGSDVAAHFTRSLSCNSSINQEWESMRWWKQDHSMRS